MIDCVLENDDAIDALLADGIPATGLMRLKLVSAAAARHRR